jgi:hypothetical protein
LCRCVAWAGMCGLRSAEDEHLGTRWRLVCGERGGTATKLTESLTDCAILIVTCGTHFRFRLMVTNLCGHV